jgi:7-cyano-7-deazaguanine synthase
MNNKAIILLSGGLDSLVALGHSVASKKFDVVLALTFDYGQKAASEEIKASRAICEYYNIEHKVIKLDWLKDITKTALVSDSDIANDNFGSVESAKSVWVPNRNALFLNIAASFCDAYGFNYILFGANRDEAKNFPDNTEEFRFKVSDLFQSSTQVKPTVVAPLINYSKSDIVKIAVEDSMPLELVRSCYNSGKGHCGKCESCHYLKKALLANGCEEYINILFKRDEN